MIHNFVLKPASWEKGRSEPETVTLSPDDGQAEKACVGFIEGSIAARPLLKQKGVALRAFRGPGFAVKRRGTTDYVPIPCETTTMIFSGDSIAVNKSEFALILESTRAKKQKLSDSLLSSSLSSSGSGFLSDSDSDNDGNEDSNSDERDSKDDILAPLPDEKEKTYKALIEVYPDRERKELYTIAQNTNSLYEATTSIFDPSEASAHLPELPNQPPQWQNQRTEKEPIQEKADEDDGDDGFKEMRMEDETDPAIERLVQAFPGITTEQATIAYESSSRDEALAKSYLNDFYAITLNEQMGREPDYMGANITTTTTNEGPLGQLQAAFPDIPITTLREALTSCKNDVEAAANGLLSGNFGAGANVPQQPPRYQRHTEWQPSNNQGEEEEMNMRGMIVNVDVNRPWQSSGEMSGTYKRYIFDQVKFIEDDRELQHTAECLQTMIEKEQNHYNDSYCFYHSYSVAHLAYELYSLIATIVYDLDIDRYEDEWMYKPDFVFPPVPRISFEPFTKIKSVSELADFCTRGGRNDGDPAYQAVGLCVSTSIFSTSSEAPPVQLFRGGYTANNVNFDPIMEKLLIKCGFSTSETWRIINTLKQTAQNYNIPIGAPCCVFQRGSVRATGHMLQIFIRKDIVDKYAYPSQAFGYRQGTRSMSDMLSSGDTNGQARLYITPDLFRNPDNAQIFYYCADMTFDENRPKFVKEVREKLVDILQNEKTRKMVRENIRGKYTDFPMI